MSTTRTISVLNEDDTTIHINVDNIAYLEVLEVEPTALSAAIQFLIPLTVGVLTFPLHDNNPVITSGFIAVVLFFILAGLLNVLDSATIATLNDSFEIKTDGIDAMEQQFRRASLELLTIEGSFSDMYNEYEYRYHLVPDNVVSISHEPGRKIPVPYILYGLALIIGAAVGSENTLVGVLLFAVLLAAGIYSSAYQRPDKVTASLQNGEEATFLMSRDDSVRLINSFDARMTDQKTVQGKAVASTSE